MPDISKALDKVWHEGLIFKLKQNGISGDLQHTLSDFLSNRMQRVVLNGQNMSWTIVHAGVMQGAILGPPFFLIYINDLADDLSINVILFADGTFLFSVVHDVNASARELNDDLKKIYKWTFPRKMSFNSDLSKEARQVVFSRKIKKLPRPSLVFNNYNLLQVSS